MPGKIDVHKIDNKVAAVMKLHEEQGLNLEETGKRLGISRATVHRITQRPAYHELSTTILDGQFSGITAYLGHLDFLAMEATRDAKSVIDPETGQVRYEERPDYGVQTKNLHRILDIFGVDAPKEHDVRHTLASLSNEELITEIERAEQKLGMDEEREQSPDALDSPEEVQGELPRL